MSTQSNPNPNAGLYKYDPSLPAAAIFAGLFIVTTVLHLFQLIRARTLFMIPLTVGGFFEIIGYIFRAINAKQTPNWSRTPFIIQTVLILLAPALFAASIYMFFGRVILAVDGESRAVIKKRFLTKFFVLGDVLSFLVQACGGAIMTGKTASKITLGQHVILVGLFLQLVWFGFFVVTAVVFNLRMKSNPTQRILLSNIPWRRHMMALYVSSGLIVVRSVFRVIAYIQGASGYLLSHEWSLYVFDAILMLGVMVMFNLIHPAEIEIIRKGKNHTTRRGFELN